LEPFTAAAIAPRVGAQELRHAARVDGVDVDDHGRAAALLLAGRADVDHLAGRRLEAHQLAVGAAAAAHLEAAAGGEAEVVVLVGDALGERVALRGAAAEDAADAL
jgi:hypothetical protein